MGISRRTLLTILSVMLPAATLTAVSAQASTHSHIHHTSKASLATKGGHHATHRTAQLRTHIKLPIEG